MKRHALLFLVMSAVATAHAEQTYQRPPREILEVLDAPAIPSMIPSPNAQWLVMATPLRYPPVSDLAEPQLRLAGVRINPRTNGIHGAFYWVGLTVKKLPEGPEVTMTLPPGLRGSGLRWNASGSMFAFTSLTGTSVDLWVADPATAKARRIDGIALNPVLGFTFGWMPDQKTIWAKTVPSGRAAPPDESSAPAGPRIEDSGGVTTASSTYESRDLLRTPHDADLFEHYATSQLALIDTATSTVTRLSAPQMLRKVEASPDGRYLLVDIVRRPFSYLRTHDRFPAEIEVWDSSGRRVETVARQPLAEQVPIRGVRTGPRDHGWRPTAPSTLVWTEALDEGDSYRNVPHHDRVMLKPVGGQVRELLKTEQRLSGLDWIDGGGLVLAYEYNLDRKWIKAFLLDADNPSVETRQVWSLSADDRYNHPGSAVRRMLPNGAAAVREHRGGIFLNGRGDTPKGNRPFLDRLDLGTLKTERLFRSPADSLEWFMEWIDIDSGTFLTKRESPGEPPNIHLRTLRRPARPAPAGEAAYRSESRQLTRIQDPTPQLRQISKRLVSYQRPDGVNLSFKLYLPPGYKEGRLPTILWAYPLDYTDPAVAGQVVSSTQEFTTISGASPVFFALLGYAVLDETSMPVVGPTETAYDTFVDQIVANAKAAIDKAVELGVTDPDRVGVGGHSHGALMTANLLIWSDLFRAGVARSGAYNHTLRPFGFQNERRTLYKAPETYIKLSPLLHADRINEPLLIIHGERDANPGTVTMQSEKLFEAIRGVKGQARMVILPLESHGYAARESIDHTLYETVSWFDKYVKNAPARTPALH